MGQVSPWRTTLIANKREQRIIFVFTGSLVSQSVKYLPLGFGSGGDLRVVRSSLESGHRWAWNLPQKALPSAPPTMIPSLSL